MKTAAMIVAILILGTALNVAGESTGTFRLPEYTKFSLKNGLTVYLMEQHEVPLIQVSALFPAGAVRDGSRSGLAYLTAESLLFGSRNYTKAQIEETLEFLGARYNTYADLETAGISLSFVNKDTDKVLDILKDIIVHPRFDEEAFARRKRRLLTELERNREIPARVIDAYYHKFLFAGHPYGNPMSGTRAAAADIEIKDIKAFYKALYKPAESVLALAGDFDTRRMKKKIRQLFEGWHNPGPSPSLSIPPMPSHRPNQLLLVNKEDATETRFIIGSFGIRRSNPDLVGLRVINTVLGGRFTAWLIDELRVNAGLTYGAWSAFGVYKQGGIFMMTSFTRTPRTVEAIDLALKVYDRLLHQGIDDRTLSSAKNYIKGQYPPRYETAGSLADLLTHMFFYGFDESFINNFQQNVDALTVEKVRELVKKYFPPRDRLQFVLIGKAAEIRDNVKKYGTLTEKEIKAAGF
jgi:zinc protease